MGYMDMMECKALIDDNYCDGLIDAEVYHAAIKGLHKAFTDSNGYLRCICLSCTR